jgi:transcription elongation factor Elf1
MHTAKQFSCMLCIAKHIKICFQCASILLHFVIKCDKTEAHLEAICGLCTLK